MTRGSRFILMPLLAVLVANTAFGQSPGVKLEIGTTVLEPGEAVEVQLVCTNTAQPDAPETAVPDGLDLRLLNPIPASSSFTQIINGRRSQRSTFTFSMRLTALKIGTYTVGPLTVVAGGETYRTDPVRIVVRETEVASVPYGDRYVYVEISVDPQSLYVTESYVATMTLGIRKVEIDGRIYDMDLLRNVLDQRASQFSVFGNGKIATSEKILRDSSGIRHRYVVYHVTQRVRAEEVGEAFVGPVFVRANYPTAVRRGFFGGYEVRRARRETARADALSVEVKGPPEEGRPEDYTGAIGRYSLAVSAKPNRVELGQPITLTVHLRGSPLEGAPGPNLSLQPELVSRFDFTQDELVGDLERGARVFRRAIFPKQAGRQTIPPISWSYFDPRSERYVTLASDPVMLTVDPPSSTTASTLQTDATSSRPTATNLTLLTGGLSPNFLDAKVVLADQSFALDAPWLALLAVSPALWLVATLTARHRRRLRSDIGFARRRRAGRQARVRILRATKRSESLARLQGLADALTGYLSDRYDLPSGTLTPGEARALLANQGVNSQNADEIVSFLETCDSVRFAPGAVENLSPAQAAGNVRRWIKELERGTRR